ncbi:energy-coupling factor transporter ATP-binding protein EcfA2 [Luteibacter sp. 621]
MDATTFQRLQLSHWRQFGDVDITFHPRLTVLTGTNGAGKTTLLNILSQHFGWTNQLLSTPVRTRQGQISYLTGAETFVPLVSGSPIGDYQQIGTLHYTTGSRSELMVPRVGHLQYNVQIYNQTQVAGLNIPSHRAIAQYQVVPHIPTSGIRPREAFTNYQNEVRNRFGGQMVLNSSPLHRMKEALIAMATFGAGNRLVPGDRELLRTYIGFIRVLRRLLPPSLGFRKLEIRTPDVVLVTSTGEFLIDAVSGGIGALIDLGWQIHTFSRDQEHFVALIDEPENHLHPSMQKSLLSSLLRAFPKVQFIVSTHSPFIVTSVRESNVYVLSYHAANDEAFGLPKKYSVRVTKLDQVNKAASANDILRDVLGVDSTIPLWASLEIKNIVSRYRGRKIDEEAFRSMQRDLHDAGLGRSLAQAIDDLIPDEGDPL